MASVWLAQEGDAEVVARLLGEFRDWLGRGGPTDGDLRSSVERLLADPNTDFLLASGDGEAAGVCQLRYRYAVWHSAEDCWLEDLFVRESARGQGLGRALGEASVARATERGCARINLDVAESNAAARELYAGLGFADKDGRSLFLGLMLDPPRG